MNEHRSSRTHYDEMLADHYEWMVGGLDTLKKKVCQELSHLRQEIQRGTRVLDIGCGLGVHSSIAEEQGASVVAIDESTAMIDKAKRLFGGTSIHFHVASTKDIANLRQGTFDIIICAGDTLTHLDSPDDAENLLRQCTELLNAESGILSLQFRDYSSPDETGTTKTVLVRASEDRIMTCVLHYRSSCVVVTDVIHERRDKGWELSGSTYRKLRLSPARVRSLLEEMHFHTEANFSNGMWTIVGRRK